MIYSAELQKISENVEGEILIKVNEFSLLCFAYASLPFNAKVGDEYQVELTAQVFGDYVISELDGEETSSITQIRDGFSYLIIGKLRGNYLEVGSIAFEDDIFLSDYGYLDGKMIKWKVDRIDADFLA